MLAQGPTDTMQILKGVEKRYNSVKTLQATFSQTYKDRGRTRPVQRGTVYLNKPGKMYWSYTAPEGNFFLSDSKVAYDYDKTKNTVERIKLKETDDMRIPLAFLLGQLNFEKDFSTFDRRQEGADAVIKMLPKNTKLLFSEITMTVAPDFTIKRVSVTGQDSSVMDFMLDNEQRNIKLNDSLFKFTVPPNAQVIETTDAQ
jgi:outer membrane lipoprotein carrier protein